MSVDRKSLPPALDDPMRAEWLAWQRVVAEWREIGLPDFNGKEAEAVIAAIVLWGECLAALRIAQPQHVAPARDDAVRAYQRVRSS